MLLLQAPTAEIGCEAGALQKDTEAPSREAAAHKSTSVESCPDVPLGQEVAWVVKKDEIAVIFGPLSERAFVVSLRNLQVPMHHLSSQSPSITPNHHPITSKIYDQSPTNHLA